jgi:hypothetical protein
MDVMLLYHLLRNFVSAAEGSGAAEARKALALAPLLRCAIERLGHIPASPVTLRQLDTAWLAGRADLSQPQEG